MSRRSVFAWTAVMVLAAALVGCAGDGGGSTGPEPTTVSTAASAESGAGGSTSTTTAPSTSTAPTSPDPSSEATDPAGGAEPVQVDPATSPVGSAVAGSLVTADGRTRTYRTYVPSDVAPGAPVLLALHGGSGNGRVMERKSGLDGLAEANGFVVVYPDGTPTALGAQRLVWNAGGCCAAAVRQGVDDVSFLVQLAGVVAAEHGTAADDVFVTGHSNGAMMALRLGCEAADRFGGVAVQAGTVFVDDCTPARPIRVLDLHGTADRNLPPDGGVGSEGVTGLDYPPVRDGLARFASVAGCDAAAPIARPGILDGVSVESWSGCTGGAEVALALVLGAGHEWLTGEVDASRIVWEFLVNGEAAL